MAFLDYVANEYEVKLSNRAKSSFYKNKERDLAIIALLLASGVRLSEAVNLDLKDVNLNMMVIEVTRKGGKRDSVNVAAFAKPYLENYLAIRSHRYHAEKTDTAFFLSLYRGVANRMDASSIEKMVGKYSEDFKIRVTPHKLRHTLATRLYDATKSQVLVSHQLGHASTQVTDLYTHIVNDEQKNALDKL
ncbi:Tyrosine recombinase XerC [Streptococcus sp. DD12]|nr:Tyrosine recombinase XerC [Streptococcus sp. DD12]